MTGDLESLALEQLRYIRKGMDEMRADVSDVKARLSATEEIQGQILVQMASLNRRMDRSDERLGRIERRLELAEV